MINRQLTEIVRIILFIKNMTSADIAKEVDISYAALRNFIVRNAHMRIENLQKIFNFLDFDLLKALSLAEKKLPRKELIQAILNEVKDER